jgi:hypothetical protein
MNSALKSLLSVPPKNAEQIEEEKESNNLLGQLFTDQTYATSLSDHIVSFLSQNDLQILISVNRFCNSLCDREFSKIARLNAFTTKFQTRNLLQWKTESFGTWYL